MRSHIHPTRICYLLLTAIALFMLSTFLAGGTIAQESTRTFAETGKTIRGKFLVYWDTHGGLQQQGFPISEEMQEKSETDGKTYTVQYFERAVFELHPENQSPYDVLLSLLGSFRYKQIYPGGAPGQVPNNETNSRLFSETGKRVGGLFLGYWNKNGGLAQQGLPISDEFNEVSALDGKTYKVQYFERAVFELHSENQAPYNVLLAQLGVFQYRDKYVKPTPTQTAISLPTPLPPATSLPTATPQIPLTSCDGIPESVDMEVGPNCAPMFTTFRLTGVNFPNDTYAGVYAVTPSNKVFGAPFQVTINHVGRTQTILFVARPELLEEDLPGLEPRDLYGVWTTVMEGTTTHKKALGYFKLTPYAGPTPQP